MHHVEPKERLHARPSMARSGFSDPRVQGGTYAISQDQTNTKAASDTSASPYSVISL